MHFKIAHNLDDWPEAEGEWYITQPVYFCCEHNSTYIIVCIFYFLKRKPLDQAIQTYIDFIWFE